MKAVLVYQAGIANVFQVEEFAVSSHKRGVSKRLLQHAFGPCEWFARGLRAAGWEVKQMGCNQAGDVQELDWTTNLSDLRSLNSSIECGSPTDSPACSGASVALLRKHTFTGVYDDRKD